ncbi:TolC family protein [Plastoroseomonas hellenica]|uniref:TolC family protein n=1 Tax=Plastoroseomonas hellenica TaxID=2687306 RepID=UPI001BA4E032|nr:TolC family protein [Plastoroseomonas hellenica]MBR0642134.1 TolC family protein [Plastoroseomonas hellenica]
MRFLIVVVAAATMAAAMLSGVAQADDRPRQRGAAASPAPARGGMVRVSSPDEAVDLALRRSPLVGSAEAATRAARGELRQAGLLPNPELSVTAENAAGTGQYRGARSLETTAELRQRLEVGGQRAARVGVAQSEVALAERELLAARLDLVRDVRKALADAIAARRAVAIEAERARLAQETLRTARERVQAGRDAVLQERRAEVVLSTAELGRQRAERMAELALRVLATLLAADTVELSRSDRWFDQIGSAPDGAGAPQPEEPAANPDFARWNDALQRAQAALELERRRAVPDVTLGLGVRRYRETHDTAMLLSLSVPLPVFDRNQGGIARAGAQLSQAEFAADNARRTIATSLGQARAQLAIAWREANGLRRSVLPAAEQAFGFARAGYQEGRFAFLEVLDAQRTLFEARGQLNEALREFHMRRAEADRLAGVPNLPTQSAGDRR